MRTTPLSIEDKLGVLLPCNVIVRECAERNVEVASVDPVVAMERTGNPALARPALEFVSGSLGSSTRLAPEPLP